MKNKIITRLIGWAMIFIIIIAGMLCSCEVEKIQPCLNGVYSTHGIELVFDNGKLTGQTDCNILNGEYFTSGNCIDMDLKSTKVFCINEYKFAYMRNVLIFELTKDELILSGNDFEIILNKVK